MMNKRKNILIAVLLLSAIIVIVVVLICLKKDKVYTLKEYYPNGYLKGINEYTIKNGDTIMNGKFVNYNDKGIKISEGQFLDDDVFGKCFYYYDNGSLESISFRKNKEITKETIEYYLNSNIKRYIMFDPFGMETFIARYNEDGKIKNYEGYPVIEIYQYKFSHKEKFNLTEDQYLKVGDTLKYSYLIANMPNAKRSFTIENLSVDNAKVKRITKKVEPCQLDVKEVLTKKGKNTIRSIVKYEFNDNVTPVFRDTLSFDINVN